MSLFARWKEGRADRAARFERLLESRGTRENLKRKAVHGALSIAASGGVDFALRLGFTFLLARLLQPQDFGILGMVTAITGVAGQFSALGLSTATVQAAKLTHEQASKLFWINVAAGLGFALVVGASAPLLSWFYHDERLTVITLALALPFLASGMTVQHEALLNRQMKQPHVALSRLVASVLSSVLGVVLALRGFGYWALVWREASRPFIGVLGAWILCPWAPSVRVRHADVRSLLRFGGNMTVTHLLAAVISRLDGLLVGKFAGAVPLGLYRQAYNLVLTPADQINAPILTVSQRGMSMLREEPTRYQNYYRRIVFIVSLLTMPLGVFSIVHAADIVPVVLGSQWAGAVIFVQIMGVAAAIRPALGSTAMVLVTTGQSGRLVVVMVVHSVTLVALMLAGVPWGAVGIALAHVGTTVLTAPWKLKYSFHGSPVTTGLFFRAVSAPLVGSLVLAGGLALRKELLPMESALASLLAGLALGAVLYGGTICAFPSGRNQALGLAREVMQTLKRRTGGATAGPAPQAGT